MDVGESILKRRARRVLDDQRQIGNDEIRALADAIMLSPSCFNNQPWRITFVRDNQILDNLATALSRGNEWATKARLILVVASKEENDCILGNRQYFLFDCGLAIGQLMLRATELGLIAHPIAGFNPVKAREILGIPEEYTVITFVICGYPGTDDGLLSEKQIMAEKERPERKPIGEVLFLDRWGNPFE